MRQGSAHYSRSIALSITLRNSIGATSPWPEVADDEALIVGCGELETVISGQGPRKRAPRALSRLCNVRRDVPNISSLKLT